jgi:hypothetical protein
LQSRTVGSAGQRDIFNPPYRYAAKFHGRAHVQTLHGLIDVSFGNVFFLEDRPRSEHDDTEHADDDGTDYEDADLKIAEFFHAQRALGVALGDS